MATLTELGRRVLGHLPAWAEDEAALIEAEGGPDLSIRSYTLDELVERLAEDSSIEPPLSDAAVQAVLGVLKSLGYASSKGGRWRMNKAGLRALVAPVESNEPPGAVVVEMHPAHAVVDTGAEASA